MNFKICDRQIWVALLIFLASCGSGDAQQTSSISAKARKFQKLNISILLDLSDRISPEKNPNPSMEFYKRDLGYIQSIVEAFEKHLLSKPVREDDEYLQVYFEPAPADPAINDLAKKLRSSFTRANTTKNSIAALGPNYAATTGKIYELAIKNKKFIGSDIWGFFKNKVKDYCIKPGHRNILFILTDGYMYHADAKFTDGNKTSFLSPKIIAANKLNTPNYKDLIRKHGYGFVKATDNLGDLEVVILGVNPARGNPFEGDVINEYWVNWLQSMKVKGPVLKPINANLPSDVDNIIKKIIKP